MLGGGSLGGSNLHGRDCAAGFRSWMMGIFGKGGQTSKSWDVGPRQPASQPRRAQMVFVGQLPIANWDSPPSTVVR